LFDIGVDGGEQETDGEMLAETEEVPYECGPRQKYPMLFEEPVPLQVSSSFCFIVVLKYLFLFMNAKFLNYCH
jgi:hypothetical protein